MEYLLLLYDTVTLFSFLWASTDISEVPKLWATIFSIYSCMNCVNFALFSLFRFRNCHKKWDMYEKYANIPPFMHMNIKELWLGFEHLTFCLWTWPFETFPCGLVYFVSEEKKTVAYVIVMLLSVFRNDLDYFSIFTEEKFYCNFTDYLSILMSLETPLPLFNSCQFSDWLES